MPSLCDIWFAEGNVDATKDWGKAAVIRREMISKANKLLVAFEKMPASVQQRAEERFFSMAVHRAGKSFRLESQNDYLKFDLLRMWMRKSPILYDQRQLYFIRMGSQNCLEPVPNRYGIHWSIFEMEDMNVPSRAERCRKALARGAFVIGPSRRTTN